MKKYYYAKLNDQDICVEVVSRVEELKNVTGYIELPEYNESYYYRRWLGDQWSQETYHPSIDTMLQDKVESFEGLVQVQNDEVEALKTTNANLSNQVEILNGSIMELTQVITILQGGSL